MEPKKSPNSQSNSELKNKAGGITLPDPRNILQVCSNQNSMVLVPKWYQNRDIDQWNRTKALEETSHIYNHLIFDKPDKNKQ